MGSPKRGRRRDDYSISCPECGSGETYPVGRVLAHYRCRKCGADFHIEPNACRACGRAIADGAEYCDAHRSDGYDDGKDDLFVEPGLCLVCQKRQTYKFFEVCKECLEEWDPDYRDHYVDFNRDDDEEDLDDER